MDARERRAQHFVDPACERSPLAIHLVTESVTSAILTTTPGTRIVSASTRTYVADSARITALDDGHGWPRPAIPIDAS